MAANYSFRTLPLLGLHAAVLHPVDCRHRRSPPDNSGLLYAAVPIGDTADSDFQSKRYASTILSIVPGLLFLVSLLAYIVSGAVCALVPPSPTVSFGDHVIPDTSRCVRVSRHADYATTDISIGTPVKTLRLLLRLDMVNIRTRSLGLYMNTNTNMRLFSSKVAESATVACVGTLCTDVILMSASGPNSNQERVVAEFEYTNPTTEALTYSTAVTLNLDGELQLAPGNDYFLTATHFCWNAESVNGAEGVDGGIRARIVDGRLLTNASQLALSPSMHTSPIAQAHLAGSCANASDGETELKDVVLFPHQAAAESSWLGLSSTRVYETSPDGVDDRRSVVELGTTCATVDPLYFRAHSLYQLDCLSAYTPCETLPTVPFRRIADTNLRIHIAKDNATANIWTLQDSRMSTLPRLEDGESAMWLSLVKLGLMTLAAAVTWVRAAKSTSSHDRLFIYCVRTSLCHVGSEETVDETVVLEDALIGLTAVAARFAVSVWRIDSLGVDSQVRAPVVQLVASVLSFCQWVVRYFVLERRCEAPLTKLGGSTALIDATSAVLLGFAQPPLLVSSEGRFDPTARLLTALLITTMTLQRCLFATACCGVLWVTARRDAQVYPRSARRAQSTSTTVPHFDPEYVPILLFVSIAWIFHAAATGILLADVFCTPFAFSMSRRLVGGWIEIGLATFFAITAASLPQMLQTVKKVAEKPVVSNSNHIHPPLGRSD